MKSRLTPLLSSTTANGPNVPGSGRPRTSGTNRDSACLPGPPSMVWFSSMLMPKGCDLNPGAGQALRAGRPAGRLRAVGAAVRAVVPALLAVDGPAPRRQVVAAGHGGGGRGGDRAVRLGQQIPQDLPGDPPERAPWARAVEHRHLERARTEHAGGLRPAVAARRTGARRPGDLQGLHGDADRLSQLHAGPVGVLELGADRVGGAAHDHELRLVGDRAVVGDAVELVAVRRLADRGEAELHLVGLLLLDEGGAEHLGVEVGEHPARDVTAVVGVAAGGGPADAGVAQRLELVVAPDGGEPDAVVDLGDLAQGAGPVLAGAVLGDEQHAAGV